MGGTEHDPMIVSQTLLLKKLKEAPLAVCITHTLGRVLLSSPVASLLLQSPKTKPEIGIAGVKHHTLLENSFQWLLKRSFGHLRDARYADGLLLCCLSSQGGSGHRKFSACSRVERVKTMFVLTMHFFLFNSGLKSGRTGGHTEIFEPKARSSEKVLVLNLKIVRRKTKSIIVQLKQALFNTGQEDD